MPDKGILDWFHFHHAVLINHSSSSVKKLNFFLLSQAKMAKSSLNYSSCLSENSKLWHQTFHSDPATERRAERNQDGNKAVLIHCSQQTAQQVRKQLNLLTKNVIVLEKPQACYKDLLDNLSNGLRSAQP